jgi:hypothetical protein
LIRIALLFSASVVFITHWGLAFQRLRKIYNGRYLDFTQLYFIYFLLGVTWKSALLSLPLIGTTLDREKVFEVSLNDSSFLSYIAPVVIETVLAGIHI